MNPMGLFKIKPLFEQFTQDHPKLLMFFMAAADSIDKDSVLEVTVRNSKGETMKTNIRVNDNDIALFGEIKKMQKK